VDKVVFDTNILVSALWTPGGNPAKIIALMPLGKILPCYTFSIMKEYREVLNRKFFDAAKTCGAVLITGNKKHYPPEPFILSPAEFLGP
jgi:putative PIN family toxin of toxin-antitoxin system